jgi:hypothetical protein
MPSNTELEQLHQLIGSLRRCVTSLARGYGDTPATRRLVNDAERILNDIDLLGIDAEELVPARWLTQPKQSGEKILIPDTEYHADFWRDVDHEGIGGQSTVGANALRTQKRR